VPVKQSFKGDRAGSQRCDIPYLGEKARRAAPEAKVRLSADQENGSTTITAGAAAQGNYCAANGLEKKYRQQSQE
jgi:hypothetical protein